MAKTSNLSLACQMCEEKETQYFLAGVPKKYLFVNETLAQVTFAYTQDNNEKAREVAEVWVEKIKENCNSQFLFIVYVKGLEPIKIHSHDAANT